MKRPIDQEGANRRAVMWKDDAYGRSWDQTDVSKALHRYAGRVSLSSSPKLSAVDKRYFAEINLYLGQGQMHMNIAMGRGPDPVAAALAGYRHARPDDPMWAVFALEHECERLRRALVSARDQERRLNRLLNTLADLIAQANGPLPDTLFNRMVARMPRTVAELAASNTEDDDL